MDTYRSFLFYGSWRITLEGFREKMGEDYAKTALWNLMTCATSGEVETTDSLILGIISGCCMPNIDAARNRYEIAVENGKKGGRPATVNVKKIEDCHHLGMTHREIAENCGCSVKTVQRTLKNLDKTRQNLDIETENEKEKNNERNSKGLKFPLKLSFAENNCAPNDPLSHTSKPKNTDGKSVNVEFDALSNKELEWSDGPAHIIEDEWHSNGHLPDEEELWKSLDSIEKNTWSV